LTDRQEERVIAESPTSPGLKGDPAFAHALEDMSGRGRLRS
jgi:hypothetical protein